MSDRGSVGRTRDAVGPTGKMARQTIQIENGDVTMNVHTATGASGPKARLPALDLAPNRSVQVEAWETRPGTDVVRRVRLCVPAAPLAAGAFEGGIDTREGPVRTLATGAPPGLQLLCSDRVGIGDGTPDWTG